MRLSINKFKKQKNKNQRGFTLVEMAIVVMLFGLVIGSISALYKQRISYLQRVDTQENVQEDIKNALSNFVDTYGRYPCPASLTARRDSGNYGREAADSCDPANNLTIAANGIQTINGINGQRIRVGAVPFLELNIREEDTIDGYGKRIIYVVSENLARQATFDTTLGQIEILDENRNAITDGVNNPYAHYIILSTGENGFGGFSASGGNPNTCPALAVNGESENCDFDDATFIISPLSMGGNAEDNDDVIAYANRTSRWQIPEEDPSAPPVGVSENDITTSNAGLVGLGAGISDNPEEELDIAGVVRVQDNPYTAGVESAILSDNLCAHGSYAASDPKCFASSLIGGEEEDMKCPSGEYMVGIELGKMKCIDEFTQTCPAGSIMQGFNSDGSIKCDNLPAECPETTVNICSETKTLLKGYEGDTRNLTAGLAGNPVKVRYICKNTSWQKDWQNSGLCSCSTDLIKTENNKTCKSYSHICGNRYSGTYDRELVRTCPSGNNVWTTTRDGCSCIESKNTYEGSCPSGYTEGKRKYESTHNCTTKKCDPGVLVSDTCKCKPYRNQRTLSCPSGMTGNYKQERFYDCPSGEDDPGSWRSGYESGKYVDIPGDGYADNCVCVPSSTNEKKSCPAGQIGDAWQQVDYICDAVDQPPRKETSAIDYSGCTTPPPVICRWENFQGNGETAVSGVGKTNNGICDCDSEKGDVALCSNQIRADKFELGVCTCQ